MELDPNMLVSTLANKDNDGLGGGNGLLWIFLLILFWGGGNGFNHRGGDAAIEGQIEAAIAKAGTKGLSDTAILNAIQGNKESIAQISNTLGVQFEAVRSTLASMTNGMCDLGYKLGQDTASLMSAISGGNASLSRQLADCCCANQRAIDAAKYDMASGFCQTNTNIDKSTFQLERYVDHKFEQAQLENRAGFQGLRDYLVEEKIAGLQNELQSAQLALQNNSQTKALMDYIDSKCVSAAAPSKTPASSS